MKHRLNIGYLYELMAWMGMGDADWDEEFMKPYLTLDLDDETSFKKYVAENIKPKLDELEDPTVDVIEESLAICLALPFERINFETLVRSSLPPFELPQDCRKLFVWIAEVCFTSLQVRAVPENLEIYIDSNEVNRTTKYKLRKPSEDELT